MVMGTIRSCIAYFQDCLGYSNEQIDAMDFEDMQLKIDAIYGLFFVL